MQKAGQAAESEGFNPVLSRSQIDLDTLGRGQQNLLKLATAPTTKFLLIRPQQLFPIRQLDQPELYLPSALDLFELEETGWAEKYLSQQRLFYLGRETEPGLVGTSATILGLSVPPTFNLDTQLQLSWQSLREVGATLPAKDAVLASQAVAMANWLNKTKYCSQCAGELKMVNANWELHCPNGHLEFPRQDPCIIVGLVDDTDRLLLAHNIAWTGKKVSVIAGYIEPGESAEVAVHREVMEETGLEIDSLRYLGSQPWPFPRSFMLGYLARVKNDKYRLEPSELEWATWVNRNEYPAQVEQGKIIPPGAVSIASEIIKYWLAGGQPEMENEQMGGECDE